MTSKNTRGPFSLCAIVVLSLFVGACAKPQTAQPAAPQPAVPQVVEQKSEPAAQSTALAPQDQNVEDATILAVSKVIRQKHLTALRDECLSYQFDDESSKDAYTVVVRENHRHATCGGDPETSPVLFTVKVERSTRKMSTDQGTTGNFRPL